MRKPAPETIQRSLDDYLANVPDGGGPWERSEAVRAWERWAPPGALPRALLQTAAVSDV